MARALLSLLLTLVIAGAALLLGLVGTTLRTGRIDPLDWLLPAGVAAVLLLFMSHGRFAPIRVWALLILPIVALIFLAGASLPWLGLLSLGCGLAILIFGVSATQSRGRAMRITVIVALIAAAFLTPRLPGLRSAPPPIDRPLVGVLSAMPLQGAAMATAHGVAPIEAVGLRSPLWLGLEQGFRLHPLDALTDASLKPLRTLLLAQPRGLAPEELVALDAWVRRGGRAVILADPLLHWPDPRPLGHPARAPLTSLLDPLLAHWGLRLEAADAAVDGDADDRRILASGALLQLAGASRFSAAGKGDCVLWEAGLVARCPIGAGRALLVADADWVNDMLWTLQPDRPADRSGWTTDALDQLGAWLRGRDFRVDPRTSWLVSSESLVGAVRVALGLLLLLALGNALVARRPISTQGSNDTEVDHSWNRQDTRSDTG